MNLYLEVLLARLVVFKLCSFFFLKQQNLFFQTISVTQARVPICRRLKPEEKPGHTQRGF